MVNEKYFNLKEERALKKLESKAVQYKTLISKSHCFSTEEFENLNENMDLIMLISFELYKIFMRIPA